MQDIADLVQTAYGLDADDVVDALNTREALGPTGVGHGVALPHARIEGISHVVGAFVLLDKPIDFSSVDRQPVDLAFALFAPDDAGVEHLKALALVSRTLRNASICNKLRANLNASTLYTILTEDTAEQAA
ncbi:Nitrogen regulatory IIA protein [Sulfitobacter noctilucae]|nr:Nitrogen regulatory IIA protein [Sulfitobacter noctilucae]